MWILVKLQHKIIVAIIPWIIASSRQQDEINLSQLLKPIILGHKSKQKIVVPQLHAREATSWWKWSPQKDHGQIDLNMEVKIHKSKKREFAVEG